LRANGASRYSKPGLRNSSVTSVSKGRYESMLSGEITILSPDKKWFGRLNQYAVKAVGHIHILIERGTRTAGVLGVVDSIPRNGVSNPSKEESISRVITFTPPVLATRI
jgi:hypothetical protein